MEIRIEQHTLKRAMERGTCEAEIIDVIKTGFPVLAKYGKNGKYKIFSTNRFV
ncbi:MAG: hypothetical protein HQK94_12865 [Nitrospirae bacterium]|nr:hypothetical protein [Nitrospirota bacterium]MBF0535884.1 hypothetical protein [Nitrospirota bacterium]